MFCSTIIPTIGRATLSRAVCTVLDQELADEFEVIVVNDSGQPLPEAEWQQSPRVKIIHTNRRNRSVARNAGASLATGRYLHFLDDDDWMLPGAFQSFWELSSSSEAAWLYGPFRLVTNLGDTIAEVYPEEVGNCYVQVLSWEWIPIQASLIRSEAFFAVGGFTALGPFSRVFQDVDLARKIGRYYDMAPTARLVANIRAGDADSTTNYADMFLVNRQSREMALDTPGAFTRMRASARASAGATIADTDYWRGRIVYTYLASLQWNLQRRRFSSAASRACYALAGSILAGSSLFSTRFWRGLLRPHLNRVRVALEKSGANAFANTRWN